MPDGQGAQELCLHRQSEHSPWRSCAGLEARLEVDADLVLRTMIEYARYEKAVVVTGDGDFYSLVEYLYQKGKLETVLSPSSERCSALLKKAARERINFFDKLRSKLEHKGKQLR